MAETLKSVSRILIRASIEDVWREITKTHEPQECMFNMRLHVEGDELAPGVRISMRSPNGKYTGVVGEVLEVDPPHRYSHTFRFTSYDDPPCKVTYELEEVEDGVQFTLTSEDIPANTKTAKQMGPGGDFIVKTLKAVVESGRPPIGTRLLYTMFRAMGPFQPKRLRTENWQ